MKNSICSHCGTSYQFNHQVKNYYLFDKDYKMKTFCSSHCMTANALPDEEKILYSKTPVVTQQLFDFALKGAEL